MPLAGSSSIGIPGRMSIGLIFKHLVQLPKGTPEVINIPGANGKNRPAPIPIRQNGRIPNDNDLRLGRLLMDLVEHSSHLRSSSIDPFSELIMPPGGQPIPAGRPGPVSGSAGGSQRNEPDVVAADPQSYKRGLGVDGIQLSRIGPVGGLLRRGQIGRSGPTAADISQLSGLELRGDNMGVVVERPLTPSGWTSLSPIVRRRRIGVAQRDIPPGTTPGLRASVRRSRRRTVMPLVVPEGQQADDEYDDEAAAPAVLRHTSFLPARAQFRSGQYG